MNDLIPRFLFLIQFYDFLLQEILRVKFLNKTGFVQLDFYIQICTSINNNPTIGQQRKSGNE